MRSLGKRNLWIYLLLLLALLAGLFVPESKDSPTPTPTVSESTPAQADSSGGVTPEPSESASPIEPVSSKALTALAKLKIKGRAPKTGYAREQFDDGWQYSLGCDTRNRILKRDLASYKLQAGSSCIVDSGVLIDPYTGTRVKFVRGVATSLEVQIDHVVALSDAWQKGAQKLSASERQKFFNDPLNLLAVSGWTNSQKGDSDAASWLPPNKAFRCDYVARQIAVKLKYQLWVTSGESQAMGRILADCPKQRLPKD